LTVWTLGSGPLATGRWGLAEAKCCQQGEAVSLLFDGGLVLTTTLWRKASILLFLIFAISSCGDFDDGEISNPGDPQDEIQILAKEFAPGGELSENDNLVVFDFDEQVIISKYGRTSFSEMGIRAQETEAKDEEFRRVATKFGSEAKPFTKIRAKIKLPPADEVEWLNDSAEDAVFNYFGLLTRDGVKVDFGLQSTIVDGVPAGSWYPFINFFPGGGQERQFQAWPAQTAKPAGITGYKIFFA